MNPIQERCKSIENNFLPLKKMYPKSYNKDTTSPYTKTHVILMNGTEFESQWFMHNFARHCDEPEILAALALVRRQEQQQQKRIACLKPINESILETTVAYEQLAIDLTATLAKNESNEDNKRALDFALLEDFDHLYRFANLLKMDKDIDADLLVGKFTEIMPGRPTVAEHRFPVDELKPHLTEKDDLYSMLVASTITAAEQQTMNYYMNIAQWYKNDLGRKLYAEIAMIEEAHVTQYESLKNPKMTWLQQWVMHEFCECWLYYSMMQDEEHPTIAKIWEEHFKMEVCHLKVAAKLLKKFENCDYETLCKGGEFPKLLKLGSNKKYIRDVLSKTITLTADDLGYVDIKKLPKDHRYFDYQQKLLAEAKTAPSHLVIEKAIQKLGKDYRYQDSEHPIKELRNREQDNIQIARSK